MVATLKMLGIMCLAGVVMAVIRETWSLFKRQRLQKAAAKKAEEDTSQRRLNAVIDMLSKAKRKREEGKNGSGNSV